LNALIDLFKLKFIMQANCSSTLHYIDYILFILLHVGGVGAFKLAPGVDDLVF